MNARSLFPCGRVAPILDRRQFLARSGGGLGILALADLLGGQSLLADEAPASAASHRPPPHFPAKAKSVIWLFMEGAPSAVDTFDPKPELDKNHGKKIEIDVFNGNPGPLMRSPAGSSRHSKRVGVSVTVSRGSPSAVVAWMSVMSQTVSENSGWSKVRVPMPKSPWKS